MRTISSLIASDEAARRERYERLLRSWSRLSSSTLSVLGFLMVVGIVFCAIFAPYIAPYPEDATGQVDFANKNQPPSLEHLLGTDSSGRDILSRIMFGTRISLLMALVVLSIATSIGVTTGLVAGYFGGNVNTLIMRTTDVFLSIPPIVLALAVTAVLADTLWNAMFAISFAWWPWYTRLVQGEVLSIKEEQFVEANEALGAGRFRVMFKEILPNVIAPITVKVTLDVGFVILAGAALAFLGLGAQPPTPSWGSMIAQGRRHVTTFWWIAVMPGLAISFTVFAFNLLGDGLRDVLDVEVE